MFSWFKLSCVFFGCNDRDIVRPEIYLGDENIGFVEAEVGTEVVLELEGFKEIVDASVEVEKELFVIFIAHGFTSWICLKKRF